MIYGIIISLELTIIFELLFAIAYKVEEKSNIIIIILAQIITNPIVVYTVYTIQLLIYNQILVQAITIFMELFAIIVEALLYKYKSSIKNPWKFSILANVF